MVHEIITVFEKSLNSKLTEATVRKKKKKQNVPKKKKKRNTRILKNEKKNKNQYLCLGYVKLQIMFSLAIGKVMPAGIVYIMFGNVGVFSVTYNLFTPFLLITLQNLVGSYFLEKTSLPKKKNIKRKYTRTSIDFPRHRYTFPINQYCKNLFISII